MEGSRRVTQKLKDLGETDFLSTKKEDLSLSFTIQNKLT